MRSPVPLLLFASLAALAEAGCQLPLGHSGDAGADDAATTSDAGASSDTVGADCTAIAPGTTLCAAISACPSFVLDPTQYPHCGFRIHGDVLDLECWCNGQLCPIGVAGSCAQIPQLVQDQTEDTVCVQVNEGRCTTVGSGSSSSSSSSGSGGSSGSASCDHTCESECGGDPGCIKMCGC